MTALITTAKNAVKAKLDALKTAGTLKTVIVDDFKQEPISEKNIPSFPAAILSTPAMEGLEATNRDNLRTFTFNITVIQKGTNITTANDIEELSEAIADSFDNDMTLGGAAEGGVAPASCSEPATSENNSYIAFTVTIKVRILKTLSF